MSEKFVAAIDQGTTSTRCMVFNREGRVVSVDQKEHEQIFPKAGWVEHNANEIWENTRAVAAAALGKVDLTEKDIAAVGITNQRETALVWDRTTGKPVYNAIVWQDTRTDGIVTTSAISAAAPSGTRPRSGCRWPPTSPAPRSSGSSTTSRAPGKRPKPATWCSATWTPGPSGT